MSVHIHNLDISINGNPIVHDVELAIADGERVGLIGSSGSGKSMIAKAMMGILPETARVRGGIDLDGTHAVGATDETMADLRGRYMGMVFQNPSVALNPVMTVAQQVGLPLYLHYDLTLEERVERVKAMLAKVGLAEDVLLKYPHELSGGQQQRVGIATALITSPRLIIADEPTTALDVTIQAQILKLMNELREKNGTAVLFITHDLGVINQMADNVAVMYCGQVVEYAPAETIFHKSVYSHPYTEGLMLSIPRLDTPSDERLEAIPGAVPHPLDLPKGCKFAPRCKYATARCQEEEPELIHVSDTQQVRCFYAKKEDRHAK